MKTTILGSLLLLAALLGGCTTSMPAPYQPVATRFYLETRPGEVGTMVQLPQSGAAISVGPRPVLAEFDVVNAEVVQVDLGRCLLVELTPAATRDLGRLSAAAMGRRLVLTIGSRTLGARRIDQVLADGRLLVFVEVPDDRLPELAAQIKRTGREIALAATAART